MPFLNAYGDGAAAGWYDHEYLPWVARVHANAAPSPGPLLPLDDGVVREADSNGMNRLRLPLEPINLELLRHQIRTGDLERLMVPVHPIVPSDPVDLSPNAKQIYDALLAFPRDPVDGRVAARRLLAVAVTAAAMPHLFGLDSPHADVARGLLVFKYPELTAGTYAPQELAGRLQVEVFRQFTSMSAWEEFVDSGLSTGVLPMSFEVQKQLPPCTGKLIPVSATGANGEVLATYLTTTFNSKDLAKAISFKQAKKYLEPSNWQYRGSFWCTMTNTNRKTKAGPNVNAGGSIYNEVVATSCPPSKALWSVKTSLAFWPSSTGSKEAATEYDLAVKPTAKSDIDVDQGSLELSVEADGSFTLVTKKTVHFTGFDGAGLAMVMCATGYFSAVEDVFIDVATQTYGQHPAAGKGTIPIAPMPTDPKEKP